MNVTACDGFIIISVETARSGVENLSIQSREIYKRNLLYKSVCLLWMSCCWFKSTAIIYTQNSTCVFSILYRVLRWSFFCFLLLLNRFFFLFACSFSCVFACESFRLIYSKVWNPILPSATLLKYYIYGCIHTEIELAQAYCCVRPQTSFVLCFHALLLLLLLRVEKYELSFCLSSYLSFEYNNIRNSKTLIIILFIIYPFAVRFWGCMHKASFVYFVIQCEGQHLFSWCWERCLPSVSLP
jgi:hypothetical protein